jgi:predicted lipoprotein
MIVLLKRTLLLTMAGSLVSCGASNAGDGKAESAYCTAQSQVCEDVIEGSADNVIVPTYQELADRTKTLNDKIVLLVDSSSEETLIAAQKAWESAHETWEQSESFLFGPAEDENINVAMDTWPIDTTQVGQKLTSDDELEEGSLVGVDGKLRGFHSVEFLLFGESRTRTADSFTEGEKDYLKSLAEDLEENAQRLVDSWVSEEGGKQEYREVFVSAGGVGNVTFPSKTSALRQLLNNLIDLADEVAETKIAKPYESGDSNEIESQYSLKSLEDFANNVRGIQMTWKGNRAGSESDGGLYLLVKGEDSSLAEKFNTQIEDALLAIGKIRAPFRDAIADPSQRTNIEDARKRIGTVRNTLKNEISPVVLD